MGTNRGEYDSPDELLLAVYMWKASSFSVAREKQFFFIQRGRTSAGYPLLVQEHRPNGTTERTHE